MAGNVSRNMLPAGLLSKTSMVPLWALSIALQRGSPSPMPVSYTHLDVYKRQVPAGPIVSKALLEQKLVLISAGTNIIRFVPPLVIEKADVDEMMKRLRAAAAE